MTGPSRQKPARDRPAANAYRQQALLYAGLTSFAVLAGLACYFLAQQLGVNAVVAAVLGLIFAFLTRVAAASLARDWLLRAAERARERRRP